MIYLPDGALTSRLITNIDRTMRSNVISDTVRLLEENGREVRRKIGGGIISHGL